MSKSVSILTPTYDERIDFLQFVARGICKQTYTNIKEWIIVDGTKKDISCLPEIIQKLKTYHNIPEIVYIPHDPKRKNTVGNLRNIAKKAASGDILIHFDDDDYYPLCRIKHAVDQLVNTKREIAGNSDLYMYDVHFESLYQFRSFGDNHILGGSMAYTKKYANTHNFDESVTHAEEGSFTNKFTEPAAVLKAEKSIIASSHGSNTYSKKKIIWDNLYAKDSKRQTMFFRSRTLRSINKNKKYIKDYLKVIKNSIDKHNEDFDITIFIGLSNNYSKYTYYDMVHDQAVYLKSRGYTIEIYSSDAKFMTPAIIDGISYKYYCQFNIHKNYNIFMWYGLIAAMPFLTNKIRLKTKKTILYNPDYRDGIALYKQYLDEIETIVLDNRVLEQAVISNVKFKNYELEEWKDKVKLINNGFCRTENLHNYSKIKNSFYICIYYKDCINDLVMYLQSVFPHLHETHNNITVHIYNFEILEDLGDISANILEEIKNKEYYIIHRNMTYSDIIQEKYKYEYQLYLYSTFGASHLSLCDLKHSIYVNCIPIISRNIFYMLPEFKCLAYSSEGQLKLKDLIELIGQICNYKPENRQIITDHNKSVFEKMNFKKNWADEILKI